MSPAAAPPRREASKPAGRPTPPLVVTRTYAPDLQRQVAALLALLQPRPHGQGKARP